MSPAGLKGLSDCFLRELTKAGREGRLNSESRGREAGCRGNLVQGYDDVDIDAVATIWRQRFTKDRDFFILGLEFNLYLARNPEVRDRLVPRRHESARRVAQFMEKRAAGAGVKLGLPTEDLANIFLITSDAFSAAALTDPDLARLYQPF